MSGLASSIRRSGTERQRRASKRKPAPSVSILTRVDEGRSGRGVFATRPIATGETVTRYFGRCVEFDSVPQSEIRYVLWKDDGRWLVPDSPSRFINHSCDPNCDTFDDPADLNASLVVARRDILRGEEITISYDTVEFDEFDRNRHDPMYTFWHPTWSFNCRCGAANCRGRIDGYRIVMPHD